MSNIAGKRNQAEVNTILQRNLHVILWKKVARKKEHFRERISQKGESVLADRIGKGEVSASERRGGERFLRKRKGLVQGEKGGRT